MNKIFPIIILVAGIHTCYCQRIEDPIKYAPLHLGITQGVGTNGIKDLRYVNDVSFNLLTGQSWRNNVFCFSGISHFQMIRSQGIYLAGISNTTGGYPFTKRNQKDSLATINAIQLAGVINKVNGGGRGAQVSGIMNQVTESFDGVQLSSTYNETKKGFSGVQLSGLVNKVGGVGIGVQSALLINGSRQLSGIQFLGLINAVMLDLDGLQLGGFNYVGNKKANVYRTFNMYWLQIGAVNYVRENGDGMQIGLINNGGNVGLSQIGIINFSKKIPQYPIGLLNVSNDAEFLMRYSRSRLFEHHIEIGTGSKKLMNTLGYSFDSNRDLKAITYSLGNQIQGGNKKKEYFLEYNLTLTQLKEEDQSFLDPNLVYGCRLQVGYNPFLRTKLPLMFFYVGCSANLRQIDSGNKLVDFGELSGNQERWLDFHFGIQID